MAKLNRNKPFGKVFGDDEARYFQDGVYFDSDFYPIGVEREDESVDDAPAPPPVAETAVDYNAMPWQGVKKLVENAGGTWSNKIDGVIFLRGL